MINIDLTAVASCTDLSPNLINCFAEAAAVLLQRMRASNPPGDPTCAASIIRDSEKIDGIVVWSVPTKQVIDSHANENDASQYGAYAVSIATVNAAWGYCVIRRALTRSGADFIMRAANVAKDDTLRLEVSGIIGVASVASRLREKRNQLKD